MELKICLNTTYSQVEITKKSNQFQKQIKKSKNPKTLTCHPQNFSQPKRNKMPNFELTKNEIWGDGDSWALAQQQQTGSGHRALES